MKLLNFIDKKINFNIQKVILSSFLGGVIGSLTFEIVRILFVKGYDFNIYRTISFLIFYLLIYSPFIVNYIRLTKRYNKIYKLYQENPKINVKAKFDYKSILKNQSYEIVAYEKSGRLSGKLYLYLHDKHLFNLKNVINKFELDDIKEERFRKLKKLKGWL